MPLGHLSVFFGEVSIYVFCPFLNWLSLILSYMSYLYILEINPLSVAPFANIFFHSEGSFHLVYGLLCCVKAFAAKGNINKMNDNPQNGR